MKVIPSLMSRVPDDSSTQKKQKKKPKGFATSELQKCVQGTAFALESLEGYRFVCLAEI